MVRIIISGLVCVMSLTACNDKQRINERIATAETVMSEQDLESSRKICDEILGASNDNGISATEYARLSILYMQFYENSDDSDALEQAVSCYHNAVILNPDSAKSVYDRLPADLHKYAFALSLIVSGLDNPEKISIDHDRYVSPDSVGVINDSLK